MAALPDFPCPTLEAADRALEAAQDRRRRDYLGMSAIGNECSRALWYGFRWAGQPSFDAATLKRFEDGHASEAVAVARLAATPGLEVHATDDAGEQFGFKAVGGHFSGHMDGVVLGLIQAPKAWHVLEIKASEKWDGLDKAKRKLGEKRALLDWNPVYYAQAVLYMHFAGLDRHYMVACSPGARKWTAVRTEADPVAAQVLIAKAEAIIFADEAPQRIGGPDNFACKWCDWRGICHEGEPAQRNCRTCLHSEPLRDGKSVYGTGNAAWRCAVFGHELSRADQEAGCPSHRFLPSLVPGEQLDARGSGAAATITYRMSDGTNWTDKGPEQ